MAVRGKLMAWAALSVFVAPAVVHAQGETAAAPAAALTGGGFMPAASNDANAPLLRAVISIDLRDAPLRTALREVSRQMGGRLMYDGAVSSLPVRVTMRESQISSGAALREIFQGTDVQVFVSDGGQLALLKRVPRTVPVDSVTLTGRVVDSVTKAPIPSVVVEIVGTDRRAVTGNDGSFSLKNVPVGAHTVSTRRLGYRTARTSITLKTGEENSVVLLLASVPGMLDEVVTTGAGERAKHEVGNSIATINADSIMAVTPAATVSELLANRIPGLLALSGSGAVGSPKRLRLRGSSSIESDNAPIVVVDGIRISTAAKTAETNTIYAGVVGGQGSNDLSSRLDDIDPNSIESIEVLKGPAASTLYGSEAANGVIVIKTKRGRAGPPRWSFYADHHVLTQPKDYEYPVQLIGWPLAGGGGATPYCTLQGLSSGSCIPEEGKLLGFNMLADPRFSPLARGYNQSIGGSVSGGGEALQYYLGGTYLDQLGTAKLPDVNAEWIRNGRGGQALSKEVVRPNARTNGSANARITGSFQGASDWALSARFISQYQRVGNDGMSALTGTPRLQTDTTPVAWSNWNGTRSQNLKHVNGSATINLRPARWGSRFTGTAVYGWDFSLNDDQYYVPKGSCKPLCDGAQDQGVLGFVNAGRKSDFVQTLDLRGSGTFDVTSWLRSQTHVGTQFMKRNVWELYGSTSDLRLGQRFYAANGAKNIQDIGDARASLGWYLEQTANIRQGKLFLTMGLRQDAGSALGESVNPIYPKFNSSWVLSNESFFPWRDQVDMFRLRFAFGNAGVMPSTNARTRTYAVVGSFVTDADTLNKNGSATGSYAQLTGTGNPWVRPERSREYEGGFDVELFRSRLMLDFTYFRKFTHDAISRAPLAGSVGAMVTYLNMLNVGDVENHGFELAATARLIERDGIEYSVTGNLTSRNNKLVRMAPGVVTFTSLNASGDLYTGNDSRIVEGYSLFGRWAYPILGWADENGNGLIDAHEVLVGDSLMHIGSTEPKYTAYLGHSLGFFRNRLRLNANFAYSTGMTQFNFARKNMLQYLSVMPGQTDFKEQACLQAANLPWPRKSTDWCFMETVKMLRLQDVAVTYTLQPAMAHRIFRASSATISATGSNLYLRSNFKGRDPGINTTPVSGNAVVAGAAFAAPRQYGVRVQLGY